jgi:hypothetical protein
MQGSSANYLKNSYLFQSSLEYALLGKRGLEGLSVLGYRQFSDASDIQYGDFKIYRGEEIAGRNKAADFFHKFWLALDHPTRADVRPAEIKEYLDHVVLMDVLPDEAGFALVTRLIGTYVANYYGEIAGKDIRDMGNLNAAARIYKISSLLLEEKAPILTITPAFDSQRQFLEAIALYMPLFNPESDKIEKIMVCVDIASISQPPA